METTTIDKIKKAAGKLLETKRLSAGRVLDVRFWAYQAIVEIDLHLPRLNMHKWTEVPYIKFKVDTLTYRDYTPACWDADTRTCSLFINAAHNGAGSNWARNLMNGDTVNYFDAASTRQGAVTKKAVIALGDESSIGHLLALQQIVVPETTFTAALVMNNDEHRREFAEYFKSPIDTVLRKDEHGHHSLMEWILKQQHAVNDVIFYINGNNIMVSHLRKLLQLQGYTSGQIKTHRFWG